MTKEEIIEMAEQAGFMFTEHGSPIGFTHSMLEDFAKLVSEKEREACAKIADSWNKNVVWENKMLSSNIAKEIRSRGKE